MPADCSSWEAFSDTHEKSQLWQLAHDNHVDSILRWMEVEPCLARARTEDGRGRREWQCRFGTPPPPCTDLGAAEERQRPAEPAHNLLPLLLASSFVCVGSLWGRGSQLPRPGAERWSIEGGGGRSERPGFESRRGTVAFVKAEAPNPAAAVSSREAKQRGAIMVLRRGEPSHCQDGRRKVVQTSESSHCTVGPGYAKRKRGLLGTMERGGFVRLLHVCGGSPSSHSLCRRAGVVAGVACGAVTACQSDHSTSGWHGTAGPLMRRGTFTASS